MYKRVLLKLSGEALSSAEYAFDPMLLSRLADELKEVHHLGIEKKEENFVEEVMSQIKG